MNCQFEKIDDMSAFCTVCGRRIHTKYPEQVHIRCRGVSTIQKAAHYADAVTKHVISGGQTRTDEEVLELLEICEACEFYSNSTCRVCGCRISKSQSAFANKLRMKTQHCPKGKWE